MSLVLYKNNGGGVVSGIEYDEAAQSGKVLLTLAGDPAQVAKALQEKGVSCTSQKGIYQNGKAHLSVDFKGCLLHEIQDAVIQSNLVTNPQNA